MLFNATGRKLLEFVLTYYLVVGYIWLSRGHVRRTGGDIPGDVANFLTRTFLQTEATNLLPVTP